MEVPPPGMSPAAPDRTISHPGGIQPASQQTAPGQTAPAVDSVAGLLRELSQSDLTQLLQILEGAPTPDPRTGELLRAIEEAVMAQDPGRALESFRQLARLDPARAEALVSAPALASMRSSLEQLLSQLTAAAKLHADSRLAEATGKLGTATFKDDLKPGTFVSLATNLIEAGGLANYFRSAAISEAMIDPSRWVPAWQPESTRRVPLQVLIAIWLALGIVAAGLSWWLRDDLLPIICAVWAVGSVVLIVAKLVAGNR
jgi:hypothetical protein